VPGLSIWAILQQHRNLRDWGHSCMCESSHAVHPGMALRTGTFSHHPMVGFYLFLQTSAYCCQGSFFVKAPSSVAPAAPCSMVFCRVTSCFRATIWSQLCFLVASFTDNPKQAACHCVFVSYLLLPEILASHSDWKANNNFQCVYLTVLLQDLCNLY
jgi:hypothetical protein